MPRPTLSEIALRAGVARITASVALRGAPGVSAPVARRIRAIADELGYVPDPARWLAASGLRRARALSLVLVSGWVADNPHHAPASPINATERGRFIAAVAARLAGTWRLDYTHLDANRCADVHALADTLRRLRPDVAILAGNSSWGFPSDWDGCPVVVERRDAAGPWPQVELDLDGMAHLAAAHARAIGRRLGVVLWHHARPTPTDRRRAEVFATALNTLPPALRLPPWRGELGQATDLRAWQPWVRRHDPQLLLVPYVCDAVAAVRRYPGAQVVVYEDRKMRGPAAPDPPRLGSTMDDWTMALAMAVEAALRHRALGQPPPTAAVLVPARWVGKAAC